MARFEYLTAVSLMGTRLQTFRTIVFISSPGSSSPKVIVLELFGPEDEGTTTWIGI